LATDRREEVETADVSNSSSSSRGYTADGDRINHYAKKVVYLMSLRMNAKIRIVSFIYVAAVVAQRVLQALTTLGVALPVAIVHFHGPSTGLTSTGRTG
jgi:hypothetical protein